MTFPGFIFALYHSFTASLYLPNGTTDPRWVVAARDTAVSRNGELVAINRVRRDKWEWQVWIIQKTGSGHVAYQLPHGAIDSRCGSGAYSSTLHISPDGKHVFEDQKTGSGDNFAAIYSMQDGRLAPDAFQTRDEPGLPLSEKLLPYFDRITGLGSGFDHYWVSWLAWEPDGRSVSFEISSGQAYPEFYIRGWRAHLDFQSGEFFLSDADKVHNRKAIVDYKDKASQKPPKGKKSGKR